MSQIDLINIHKHYPQQPDAAISALSLQIGSGQLMALLGASGSGKSTLLKLIAGIEQPDSGDIRLDGQSMLRVPAHRRGAVLMFQKAYLFPFLSVAENIAFGLKLQRISTATIKSEIRRMLELVELPDIGSKRPAQLSGGEQQRVALARALVTQPRILLLDEPFSSLDPAVSQILQQAVRRIQRELGISMVLVTHNRAEALSMADKVALIDHGRLLAHASPQHIYLRPPDRQAARLMGIDTFLHGEVRNQILYCQFGALQLPNQHRLGPASFAIRPEHMRLLCQPAENTFPAIIIAERFLGEQSEYQVELQGQQLRLRTAAGYAPGMQIYLQLPGEFLFPIEDSNTPDCSISNEI